MRQIFKYSFVIAAGLTCMLYYSYADRGLRNKSKRNINFEIGSNISFKNTINCDLTSGMKYKSILLPEVSASNHTISGFTLKAYQKGNTVYLIKGNQRLIFPELTQGYSGMKLIFKPAK
jgi:hypothetical protein